MGVGKVHAESAYIATEILNKAINSGMDIIYPTTGYDAEWLKSVAKEYKEKGYEVHLKLNDLPTEKCVERSVLRFASEYIYTQGKTGRLVSPDYLLWMDNKPKQAFCQLISDPEAKELFSSFDAYSNDVERNQKPEKLNIDYQNAKLFHYDGIEQEQIQTNSQQQNMTRAI